MTGSGEHDNSSGLPLSIFRQAQCQKRTKIDNIKVFIFQYLSAF